MMKKYKLMIMVLVMALLFNTTLSAVGQPSFLGYVRSARAEYMMQCQDFYEPNDGFSDAWYLSAGTIQSYICDQFDIDYFKFNVEDGDPIHLDLFNLPVNYDLCLYAPDQTWITCSDNSGTTDESISEIASQSGDYYAYIYGSQGASDESNPYTLSISGPNESQLMGQIYFDQVRYQTSEEIFLTVYLTDTIGTVFPSLVEVWVSDPHHGDAERVLLDHQGYGTYRNNTGVPLKTGTALPENGLLEVNPGNLIYALYWWTGDTHGSTGDIALISGGTPSGNFTYSIDSQILTAPTTLPGRGDGETDRPVAAIASPGYPPVRFGEDMIIYQPRSAQERDALLARRTGVVVQSSVREDGTHHVIRLDPQTQDLDDFAVLADWLGLEGHLTFSSEDAARLYNLILEENLDGLNVTLNPILMLYGQPESNDDAVGTNPQPFDEWWANDSQIQLDRAWVMASIMDTDEREVNLAVIDGGFREGPDVPTLVDGYDYEDDDANPFGENPVMCSGDGTCTWHGDWVWGTAGAIVNNAENVAGSGGQVAQPMFYRIGYSNWVFDMEDIIRHAVDEGADVINISAGFPCQLGEINYCDPGARLGLCAAVGLAIPILIGLIPLPPVIQLGLSVFGVPLTVFCFTPFNPQQAMEDAALYAQNHNATVVASAGNEVSISVLGDFGPYDVADVQVVPCVVDGVICVGEMNSSKELENNWGDDVDIWGPNEMPMSGNTVEDLFGTSGTCGYISGVVALMKAVNPALTTSEIHTILQDTGHASSSDPNVHHFVDVYAAFLEAASRVPERDADVDQVLDFCPSLGWDETTSSGNDDYWNATSLSTGVGLIGPVTDAALHAFNDPEDWYSLNLPDDSVVGRYYSVVDHLSFANRVGEPTVEYLYSTGGLPDEIWHFTGNVWPGTYYMDVLSDTISADTCYNLSGQVTAPTPILVDACEENDQIAQACWLSPWEDIGGNTWEQSVDDLTIHSAMDNDWYRVSLPEDAPEPAPLFCPGVPSSPSVPMARLTININDEYPSVTNFQSVRGADTGEVYSGYPMSPVFLDVDDYPWVLDDVWFNVEGDAVTVDPDGYSLDITYDVNELPEGFCDIWADIWDIIQADVSIGGMFWWITPWDEIPDEFHWPMELPCDPRSCDPPALLPADHMGFRWDETRDMRIEAFKPAGSQLRVQLLDTAGNIMGEALPIPMRTVDGTGYKLILEIPQVEPGYYLVKISEGDFGVPYNLWVTDLYWNIFMPMVGYGSAGK